jgi:hypothetical protein
MGKTLQDHIGGRWAISLLFYVINFPINMVTLGSNIPESDSGNLTTWLTIGLMGYVCFGVVLAAANFTVLRNRRVRPVPLYCVVAVGILAGGIRGVLVGSLAETWEVSGGGPELIVVRGVTGAVIGAIFLPLGAFILSVIATYLHTRSQLVTRFTDLQVARVRADQETQVLRETLINEAVSELSRGSSLRSVSHRVWPDEIATRERIPWFSVMRTAVLRNPYPGVIVAFLWSFSALGSLIPAIGFTLGVMQVVLSALTIWGIYTLAARATFTSELGSLLWFIAVMTFTIVLTGPVASIIFDDRSIKAASSLIIANSIWLPVLTILVSIFRGALNSAESIMEDLQSHIHSEEISTHASEKVRIETQREVAEAIHGLASRVNTSQAITGADIGLSFDDFLTPTPELRSPAEIIDSALKPWSSIVTINLTKSLDHCNTNGAIAAKRIIHEGIANAYRHGRATECDVDINSTASHITIRITDNGTAASGQTTPGLGTAILNSICSGEWKLETNENGGRILHATFAQSDIH